MNALLVLRPAKLWAFNIGHPCPSLAKGELNVVVLRSNFQLISNQSCTIVQSRPFPYPTKIRNVIIGRNLLRLTAARSEQSAATRHKTCIAPSLNPDRSAIPQKSATLAKVGICCGSQPQGRFCYGLQPPDNLHSTIVHSRPFHYPTKIRNVIKGRNLL